MFYKSIFPIVVIPLKYYTGPEYSSHKESRNNAAIRYSTTRHLILAWGEGKAQWAEAC